MLLRRRVQRLIKLTFDPMAGFDSAMRAHEYIFTAVGISSATVILAGAVFVTRGLRTGIWGTIAILAIIILLLFIRAAYQLVSEVEVKRDHEARAAKLGELLSYLNALWLRGDTLMDTIENDWKDGGERDVVVWELDVQELLDAMYPEFVVPFLNLGSMDKGIITDVYWGQPRGRAYIRIRIRLHRLKEDVMDKIDAERRAILARYDK